MARSACRIAFAAIVVTSISCSLTLGSPSGTSPISATQSDRASAYVSAAQGATLALADGATLRIPPGALVYDTQVTVQAIQADEGPSAAQDTTMGAGKVYDVDLGSTNLVGTATLELPFDPALISGDAEPDQVFLATFSEETGNWEYAGGTVDLSRNVVSAEITHASWWQPATWNWAALPVLLSSILGLNPSAVQQAGSVVLAECKQKGSFVYVENPEKTTLLQGCIERDDPLEPAFRLVNPRLIPYEVFSTSDGGMLLPGAMLSPGETLILNPNQRDAPPLEITAEVTKESSLHLALNLLISALPGLGQLRQLSDVSSRAKIIGCMLNRFSLAADMSLLSQALLDGDEIAARDHLAKLLGDSYKMEKLIQAGRECKLDPASKWSAGGIAKLSNSASLILSEFDWGLTLVASAINPSGRYYYDRVAFYWLSPAALPRSMPPATLYLDRNYYCRVSPCIESRDVTGFEAGTRLPILATTNTGWWQVEIHLSWSNEKACWIGGGIPEGDYTSVEIVQPSYENCGGGGTPEGSSTPSY